jgi:Fe2+ transport system protein A
MFGMPKKIDGLLLHTPHDYIRNPFVEYMQRKTPDSPDQFAPMPDAHMSRYSPATLCNFITDIQKLCRRNIQCKKQAHQAAPLSESCCTSSMRVCAVTGDRQTCARMAALGILPGSELEVLCKGGGHQHCMIRINGATLSLDAIAASAIMVAPA